MSATAMLRRAGSAWHWSSPVGYQTALLHGAHLGAGALGSVFLGALARNMPSSEFDLYAIASLFVLPNLGYVSELGLYSAGARLLAVAASDEEERELLGALLVAAFAIAAGFALLVASIAPLAGAVSFEGARTTLLVAAPFAVAIPLQGFVEMACQATNRIGLLAAYRLAIPVANFAALGALLALGIVTPATTLAATLAAGIAVAGLACARLQPSLARARANLRRLLAATREYGLPMYTGRILSLASARLDTLLIPWLAGVPNVGFYASAQKFTQPASSFARTMATTRFRAFATSDHVGASVVRLNVLLLSAAATGLALLGPTIFGLLYGEAYAGALPFLLPFTVVALFEGLIQPYNVFLASHGRGHELRRIAIAMGLCNLAGLASSVPCFGLTGAAWWAAASAGIQFALYAATLRLARQSA